MSQEIEEKRINMQHIGEQLIKLEQKNADSVFLNDVKTKADELFREFEDVANDFTREQEKLSQLCYLDKKVNYIQFLIVIKSNLCQLWLFC